MGSSELLHKPLIALGLSASQTVIYMPDAELEAVPPREASEGMQESGRVETTRDGNQDSLSREPEGPQREPDGAKDHA